MMHQQYKNMTLAFEIFRELTSRWLGSEVPAKGAHTVSNFFDNRSDFALPDNGKGADTVYLFGVGIDDTRTVQSTLKEYSITPCQFCSATHNLSNVIPAAVGTTYLLVDVDAIGDLEDAVDELIAFRRKHPSIVVVIISAFVMSDEFGTYRQLICDATLRSPISKRRVKGGLVAARHNKLHSLPSIMAVA